MSLKDINFTLDGFGGRKDDFLCLECGKRYRVLGPHLNNHFLKHKLEGGDKTMARFHRFLGGNSMKAWQSDDLWTVYGSDAKDKDVAELVSRSPNAIVGVRSVINRILTISDIDEVESLLVARGYSKTSRESFKEIWRRVKLVNHRPNDNVLAKVKMDQRQENVKAEQVWQQIDETLNLLKKLMVKAIETGVGEGIEDYKDQTEKELHDLRELKDIAADQSVFGMLKNKFRST